MHPLLLSSDFDPFQAAIIVIAVLAGFVKWLWENWQQQGTTPAPPPDPEEQRLREAAWRKQTGQSSAPPPLPPVAVPSAWDELRKAWKELQETAKQAQAPAQPRAQRAMSAQRQPQRQPQSQPARVLGSRPVPAAAAVPAAVAQVQAVASAPPAVVTPMAAAPVGSMLATLRHLRRDPALMRQAILMQEILGPPKALQSSRDFAI